jgi:hypothetical protein
VQKPDAHWASRAHAAAPPSFGVHRPALQNPVVPQSPSVVHGVPQVAAPPITTHFAGEQSLELERHAPDPLHTPRVIAVPLHVAGAQLPSGSWPSGIGAHVPSDCVVSDFAHAWHVPVQAVLQQTPSTQKPEVHWRPDVQAAPLPDFRMQPVEPQYALASQSVWSTQLVRHAAPVAAHLYGRQLVVVFGAQTLVVVPEQVLAEYNVEPMHAAPQSLWGSVPASAWLQAPSTP